MNYAPFSVDHLCRIIEYRDTFAVITVGIITQQFINTLVSPPQDTPHSGTIIILKSRCWYEGSRDSDDAALS